MEIHRLHVTLTDQDLNDVARKHIPEKSGIEELEFCIKPEGLSIKGVYPIFVPVSFEALWELGVREGRAMAKLTGFRTMGMPANVLKSLIMNVVADVAKKDRWLEVQGDLVLADLDGLLKEQGLTTQTRLLSIRCQAGALVVEAGALPG
jgi:hypothetical protein